MNSNYYSSVSSISIPNAKQDSSLSQPIDISYQRQGSVFGSNLAPHQQSSQSQSQSQSQQQQHQQQQHSNLQQQQHQQQQQHNSNHGGSSVSQHQSLLHQIGATNSINITNHRNFRRESIAHSQGVGGISWGSLTIGSWLKDEVMMHNNLGNYTNNHNTQTSLSPPTQSSYLPDLEANYCKDYSCCGQLLPTLHDLLKHYEESHISPTPPTHQPKPIQNFDTVSTTDVFINSNNNGQQQHQQHQLQQQQARNNGFAFNNPFPNTQQQQQAHLSIQQQQQQQQQQHNNQHNNQSHQQQQAIQQQLRSQFSNNTNSQQFDYPTFNNQVNLNQQQQQHNNIHSQSQSHHQQQSHNQQLNNVHQSQPHSSQRPHSQNSQHQQHPTSSGFGVNLTTDDSAMELDEEMDEGYIDDPSRNLYVAQGSEKPFTCPVIGCNKTYKNQNGLKYHRLHGHQNQRLHLNPDGTYSVVDPNDGNGMEQDKPYRCEVCGKRYKNLNGLKYHRGHSTH